MASAQVEDYADELNTLAGHVRRNLELIGTLDTGSHGAMDKLKEQHAAYLTALKDRVKAQKSKATGAKLAAVTEDADALAAIQALQDEALSKGEEKVAIADRTAGMVQAALTKLEAFMATYQEELRASGKWADGTYEDELELDDFGETPSAVDAPLARNFSVGADSGAGGRGASALPSSMALREGSAADVGALAQGALGLPALSASLAANVMSLTSGTAANAALLEQQALLPGGALARAASSAAVLADAAGQMRVSAANAAAAAAPTHDAAGKPLTADNPMYCVCRRVALGQMIGCDNDDCKFEWFHLPCVGLGRPIEGTWYCPACVPELKKRGDPGLAAMKEGFTEFRTVDWPTLVAMDEAHPAES